MPQIRVIDYAEKNARLKINFSGANPTSLMPTKVETASEKEISPKLNALLQVV